MHATDRLRKGVQRPLSAFQCTIASFKRSDSTLSVRYKLSRVWFVLMVPVLVLAVSLRNWVQLRRSRLRNPVTPLLQRCACATWWCRRGGAPSEVQRMSVHGLQVEPPLWLKPPARNHPLGGRSRGDSLLLSKKGMSPRHHHCCSWLNVNWQLDLKMSCKGVDVGGCIAHKVWVCRVLVKGLR
jgi:hypothetical protein